MTRTSSARGFRDRALTLEDVRALRQPILEAAARHGARNVRVFGSIVRGSAGPDSDVDFLVELERERSLLDVGALLMDLQDLLDRDVDVVTEAGLRARVRDRVLSEAVPL